LATGREGPGAARRRGLRRLQQEQGLTGPIDTPLNGEGRHATRKAGREEAAFPEGTFEERPDPKFSWRPDSAAPRRKRFAPDDDMDSNKDLKRIARIRRNPARFGDDLTL
jgi:hypothetical protein